MTTRQEFPIVALDYGVALEKKRKGSYIHVSKDGVFSTHSGPMILIASEKTDPRLSPLLEPAQPALFRPWSTIRSRCPSS